MFKFKKVLAVTMIASMLSALAPIGTSAAGETNAKTASQPLHNNVNFTDISGHWALAQIEAAVAAGYVNGYEDGTFKPNAPITEEEFLAMMVKALKLPVRLTNQGESWFAPILDAANKSGIYKGDYQQDWSNFITRGDVAQTLARATQQTAKETEILQVVEKEKNTNKNKEKLLESFQILESINNFTIEDKLSTPQRAVSYMNEFRAKNNGKHTSAEFYALVEVKAWIEFALVKLEKEIDTSYEQASYKKLVWIAVSRGLMSGNESHELLLDKTSTRAEAVAVIDRILSYNNKKELPVSKYDLSQAEIYFHGTNAFTMLPRYFDIKSIDKFDLSAAHWEFADGNREERGLDFIVVDMEDFNDPHRDFIKDYPFYFKKFNTDPVTPRTAPDKSYVIYSHNQITIHSNSGSPFGIIVNNGFNFGTIVPKEYIKKESGWDKALTEQETDNTILYTKDRLSIPSYKWNQDRFDNPIYVNMAPSTGGTYIFVDAKVIPKGDFYLSETGTFNLNYNPSRIGSYQALSVYNGTPNYNISNP
ncbi:S-layer homology domain-containing protein [Paenibacillus sp. 1_12]|uniref:S-layer homology domain-containing protein n=1 Tax=Paenibacillus sp. 1_12 TaxID=1566278 RepID=UPI0008E8AD9E|nr:S-layer homology domain-containing protein [Paenibacillus sp. 1_12]SFM12317.1 S-layer homology domain-containing protein [Paenibacillus sp. 1_12]